MDNLNVSKETIHIKKNQSSTATQTSDLVFLELSGQVVCVKCHQDHYSTQPYRPFRERGSCQCLHPNCGETDRERYKMMVRHKNKNSGEPKTECLLCIKDKEAHNTNGAKNFVIGASIVKNTIPHRCKHNFKHLNSNSLKVNFKDFLFPFSPESCIQVDNKQPFEFLTGSSLYIERYQCFLSQSFNLAKLKEKDFDFNFYFLSVIIQSQIPWFHTSLELITMINPQYKQLLSQRARKALLSILKSDSEESIDDWLFELFKNAGSSSKTPQICLFLDSFSFFEKYNANYPSNSSRSRSNQILTSSSIYSFLIGLNFLQSDKKEWDKFVNKESTKQLVQIMSKNKVLLGISEFEDLNRMASCFPTYDLDVTLPNESELVSMSNRLNFVIRQTIYGDYSQEQSLSFFKEILSNIISLLGISNSINHKQSTSSPLTPGQKAKLFYCTPLVNTILMTAQILKEEHHKAVGLELPTTQFESVFTDVFSIMTELGRECYDISILWLYNFKTLMDGHLPESSRAEFEIIHLKTLRYLLDFSSNSTYIEKVTKMNKEILTKMLCFRFSIEFEGKRNEFELLYCKYEAKLPEGEKDEREDVSDNVFILISILYFPEDFSINSTNCLIADKIKDLKFSKRYLMLAFIMPETNQKYTDHQILKGREVPHFHESLADKILKNSSIDENERVCLLGLDIFGVKNVFRTDNCLPKLPLFKLNLLNTDLLPARLSNKDKSYDLVFKSDIGSEKYRIVEAIAKSMNDYFSGSTSLFRKSNFYCHVVLLLKSIQGVSELSLSFMETKTKEIENEDPNFYSHLKKLSRLNEYIYELTQNTEIDTANDEAVRNHLLSITESSTIHIQEIFPSRFTSLVKHIQESVFRFSLESFNEFSDCSLGVLSFKTDLLAKMLSEKHISKIDKNHLNVNITQLSRHLIYHLAKFLNPKTNESAFCLYKREVTLLANLFKIFMSLIKSKQIEARKLVSQDKIEFKLQIRFKERYKACELKDERTLLEILIMMAVNFASYISEFQLDKETINIYLSLLTLMSEILEGLQSETIELLVNRANYILKNVSDHNEILHKWQDVFLKIYFDLHTTDAQKLSISTEINTSAILERIKELKTIDFIKNTLESTEDKKLDKLLSLYYSSNNTYYEQFDRLTFVFSFLRFHSKYDLSKEIDQDLILVINMLDKVGKKVEIKIQNTFREIFFFTHPDALLFSKDKVNTFIDNVDRSSIASKNQDTIDYALHFRDEIEIEKSQPDTRWRRMIDKLNLKWLVLVCLIATLGSVYLMVNHTDVSVKEIQDSTKSTFIALLIVQMVIAIITLSIWLATKFRPVYSLFLMQFRTGNNISKGQETTKDKLICRLQALFYSVEPVCAFGILFSDILAVSSDSLYWTVSLQLLCFIAFSKNLANIIKAIQLRSKQLGLISVFLMILLFISGVLTFTYMSESFQTEDGDMLCLTMGHCLASQLDYGFRMGGGMGDNMPVKEWDTKLFWRKFVYSMSHFILFPVIMLNVVAGIIIDTFADLREQTAQLQEDKDGVCIVCGKEIGEIKKEEGSYAKHVKEKHNVINYMLFIKYILEKEEIELNYIEGCVRKKLEEKKIDWFPSNEEDLDTKLEKMKGEMKSEIKDEITRIETKIDIEMQNILTKLSAIEEINQDQNTKLDEDRTKLEETVFEDLKRILPRISEHIDLKDNEDLTGVANLNWNSLSFKMRFFQSMVKSERYPPITKNVLACFAKIVDFKAETGVNP